MDDDLTPSDWKDILRNASAALRSNPNDLEARQAVTDAQDALRANVADLESTTQAVNAAEQRKARDPGFLASLGIGASQGATFGLADEAAGLIAGAGALLPGGESPGEAYRRQVGETRETLRGAQENRPFTALAGDIVGSLPGGVGAYRAAGRLLPTALRVGGRAARALGTVVRSGIAGAGIGGVEGAARAEGGPTERARGAKTGATVGGVAGVALPIGGAVVNETLVRPVRNIGRRVLNRLAGSAGTQAAEQIAAAAKRIRALPDLDSRLAILPDRDLVVAYRQSVTRAPRVSQPRASAPVLKPGSPGTAEYTARQFGVPVEQLTDPNFKIPPVRPVLRGGNSVGGRQPRMDMESPAFRRRATDLGQPQRPVPQAEVSGVGNPPVNPEGAVEYVRSAQRRLTPEGQGIFGAPPAREAVLASLDLPPAQLPPGARRSLPSLTLERGGRFSRRGSQMATRQLPPEQQQALERLVVENLLESPRLGQTPLRAPRGMSQADAARLVEGDLRASAEVRARVQKHAPKGRGAYRAQQLARGPSPKPSTEEIAARQFEMLRQAAESGDEDAIRAIEALTGLGGPSPRGPF